MEQYLVGRMFNNSMFNSALDELKEIMYFIWGVFGTTQASVMELFCEYP